MDTTTEYLAKLDEQLRGDARRAGVVEGGRVRFTYSDGTVIEGTVKKIEYTDIRVIWDNGTQQGRKATWTALRKLTPIN